VSDAESSLGRRSARSPTRDARGRPRAEQGGGRAAPALPERPRVRRHSAPPAAEIARAV